MDVPVDPCAPRWSRCPPPGFRGGPAALAAARTRAVTRVPKSVQRLVAKQPLAGKGRSAALLARIWVRQRLLKRAPGMLAMGRELNAASAARRSCHRRASRHRDRAPRPPRQLPDPAGTGAAAVREPAGRWDRGWSPGASGPREGDGSGGRRSRRRLAAGPSGGWFHPPARAHASRRRRRSANRADPPPSGRGRRCRDGRSGDPPAAAPLAANRGGPPRPLPPTGVPPPSSDRGAAPALRLPEAGAAPPGGGWRAVPGADGHRTNPWPQPYRHWQMRLASWGMGSEPGGSWLCWGWKGASPGGPVPAQQAPNASSAGRPKRPLAPARKDRLRRLARALEGRSARDLGTQHARPGCRFERGGSDQARPQDVGPAGGSEVSDQPCGWLGGHAGPGRRQPGLARRVSADSWGSSGGEARDNHRRLPGRRRDLSRDEADLMRPT